MSFREGGVTLDQYTELYKNLMEIKWEEMCFQAALNGVDLEKETKKHQKTSKFFDDSKKVTSLFGDPSEYENMSEEEKQKLTDEMMDRHKLWVMENKILGKK